MKEEVIELYREGLTYKEIAEETGLAPSTVQMYVYQIGANHDLQIRQNRMVVAIRKMIEQYETEFGEPFATPTTGDNNK